MTKQSGFALVDGIAIYGSGFVVEARGAEEVARFFFAGFRLHELLEVFADELVDRSLPVSHGISVARVLGRLAEHEAQGG
jgi:hypothetical protein